MTSLQLTQKKLLLYEQARGKSLRGVNSPGTRLISAGAKPFFITRTVGPYIYDPNGGNFIHSSCNSIQECAGSAYRLAAPFDAMFISLAHSCAELCRATSALIDWTKQEIAG